MLVETKKELLVIPQLFSLNNKEKEICVSLARESISAYLQTGTYLEACTENYPKKLLEKKACFVTLMKNGQLRGCIGRLQAFQPLYLDIIQNAVAAAIEDPRFSPVGEAELPLIKIEVSVLTNPIPLPYKNAQDLIKKIRPKKDGLIIKKGSYQATFLPSVWEELPKKEDFLSQLCLKAGLSENEWTLGCSIKVERYEAIKAVEGK